MHCHRNPEITVTAGESSDIVATAPLQCPVIPEGGLNAARLSENMAEARSLSRKIDIGLNHTIFDAVSRDGARASVFATRVKTGGIWDTKNLRSTRGKLRFPKGQDYGDFQYGALAHQMGYSWEDARAGANTYSIVSNLTFEHKMPLIRQGWLYAKIGCGNR